MKSLFITGVSGFVGSNLIKLFSSTYEIVRYKKGALVQVNQDIVIHLAGKAHDLKRVSSSDEYSNIMLNILVVYSSTPVTVAEWLQWLLYPHP